MAKARILVKPPREQAKEKPFADDLRDLDELEKGLKIDEHALDEALQQQPDLFYRVSKTLAMLTSRRDAMKQEKETVEAQADLTIRRKHARDKDKATEGSIRAEIRLDREVIEVGNELLELANLVAQFAALKEAFQQRSYVLKDLVNLYTANYFGDSAGGSSRTRMRDHAADNYRDARRDHARAR